MKYQTQNNLFPPIKVVKSRESQTVPDMSYTPRQIIAKFSRGEKVPLGFNGLFDSEDPSDRLDQFDPAIFEDDPTRDPSFDFGDYVEEKHALDERSAERSKRSKAKSLSNAKRKASYDEVSASDPRKRETTSGAVDNAPNAQ